jgi:hypothetical protein
LKADWYLRKLEIIGKDPLSDIICGPYPECRGPGPPPPATVCYCKIPGTGSHEVARAGVNSVISHVLHHTANFVDERSVQEDEEQHLIDRTINVESLKSLYQRSDKYDEIYLLSF